MADFQNIASLIALGPRVPSIDFSALGNLPNAYWEGLNQAYQQRNRDLFQNGVPGTDREIANAVLKAGGAPALPNVIGLQELDALRQITNQPLPGPAAPEGGSGYTAAPSIGAPQPQSAPPASPAPQQSFSTGGNTFTLRKIASANGFSADDVAAALSAQGAPVTPDTPLPRTQQTIQAIRDAVTSARPNARVAGEFSQMQPSPQGAPSSAAPSQSDIQAMRLEATARRAEEQANEIDRRAAIVGAKFPGAQKALSEQAAALHKQASDIRESLLRQREKTTENDAKTSTALEEDVVKSAQAAQELQPYIDRAITAYQRAIKEGGIGPIRGSTPNRAVASVFHTDAESARQDYDMAVNNLKTRITKALNKGEGTVSNYERKMYSMLLPDLTASDPEKQLDYLKGIQSFTAQTIDAGRGSKLAQSPAVAKTFGRTAIPSNEGKWTTAPNGARWREIK